MVFVVRTRVAPSPIAGLGVFAVEDIPKGAVVWRFEPPIDIAYTAEDVAAMSPVMQELMSTYAYLHGRTGLYIYCGDNARFENHSDTPNTESFYPPGDPEGCDIAARDIKAGEELTGNYFEFDEHATTKLRR